MPVPAPKPLQQIHPILLNVDEGNGQNYNHFFSQSTTFYVEELLTTPSFCRTLGWFRLLGRRSLSFDLLILVAVACI